MSEVYKEYNQQCAEFPYPDEIYVDSCFEFHCNGRVFYWWNLECKEKEFAYKIYKENKIYFAEKVRHFWEGI